MILVKKQNALKREDERTFEVLSGVDERLNERPSSRDKGATADHEAGREELRSGA